MNNKAFTLVELLVAVVILAIGIVGVLRLNVSGIWGARDSDKITCATTALRTILEENIMLTPFEDLDGVCSSVPSTVNICQEVFTVHCQMVEVSDRLKQVLLNIYWGYDKHLTLSLYRAQGE